MKPIHMKINHFAGGLKKVGIIMSTSIMVLTGCSDDMSIENSSNSLPDSYPAKTLLYSYVRFSPSTAAGTRADNPTPPGHTFEDGVEAENNINNMMIIFYDELKAPIAFYNTVDWTATIDPDNSNQIEKTVQWNEPKKVPIELWRPGKPIYAVALLNYDPAWNVETLSIDELRSVIKNTYSYTDNGKDYFLMTNSGFFDESNKYQIIMNVEDFIWPTEKDAMDNPVTIYVERAAAKVDLEVNGAAISDYDVYYGQDVFKFTFEPQSWGLTATETENYLLKNSSDLSAYTGDTYPTLFSQWVNYEKRRTFWAESVNFNGSYFYPQTGLSGQDKSKFTLKYLPYTDLNTNDYKLTKTGNTYKGSFYTFEHTFPAAHLNAEKVNPYAVPTSMVLYGKYTAKSEAGEALNFNDKGFYIRGILFGTDKEGEDNRINKSLYLEKNASGYNDLHHDLVYEQLIVAKGTLVNGKMNYALVRNWNGSDCPFEIKNTQLFYYSDGSSAPSSNAYTLQLKASAITGGDYYKVTYVPAQGSNPAYQVYQKITVDGAGDNEISLAAVNEALQKQLGSASYYKSQMAYFYAPVLHYIDDGKYEEKGYDGGFTYAENSTQIINKTGEFGIVRNHYYKLTVSSIKGLGYGQAEDAEFPLPDPEENRSYYFEARLQILPWQVIDYKIDL